MTDARNIPAELAGEVEPVAVKEHGAWGGLECLNDLPDGTMLYTSPPASAIRDALAEVRGLLIVERMDDGRIGGIRHGSDALPEIVAILDAALSSRAGGET